MRSKISPTEWKLLIGFFILIDIGQLVLDGFAIGLIVNRIIDLSIGFMLPVYFYFRGVSMMNLKRGAAFLAALGLETFIIGDAFPLWTLDIIYMNISVKGEEALAQVAPVVSAVRSFDRRIKRLPQNKS